MFRKTIDWSVFRDSSWWHWAASIPLLAAHVAGYPWALATAMALCAAVGGHYWFRLKELRAFPVQMRIAYLALLAGGMLPWMQWIHWVQLIGTTAMVTVGYCLLSRILRLAPLNRAQPLSLAFAWRMIVREPCAGGLLHWTASSPSPVVPSCSPRASISPVA